MKRAASASSHLPRASRLGQHEPSEASIEYCWGVQRSSPISRGIQNSQSMMMSLPKTQSLKPASTSRRPVSAVRKPVCSSSSIDAQRHRLHAKLTLAASSRHSSTSRRLQPKLKDSSSYTNGSYCINRSASERVVHSAGRERRAAPRPTASRRHQRPMSGIQSTSKLRDSWQDKMFLNQEFSEREDSEDSDDASENDGTRSINCVQTAAVQRSASDTRTLQTSLPRARTAIRNKKTLFRSVSLQLQVALSEHMNALNCLAVDDPIERRLEVSAQVFEQVIHYESVLGPLLRRIKAEYEHALDVFSDPYKKMRSGDATALEELVGINRKLEQSLQLSRTESSKKSDEITQLIRENDNLKRVVEQNAVDIHDLRERLALQDSPRSTSSSESVLTLLGSAACGNLRRVEAGQDDVAREASPCEQSKQRLTPAQRLLSLEALRKMVRRVDALETDAGDVSDAEALLRQAQAKLGRIEDRMNSKHNKTEALGNNTTCTF